MTRVTGPTWVLTLEGARVVSPERAVAAPFATRQLADLGARVVKTERPWPVLGLARSYDETADGLARPYAWLARSRGSHALGLIAQAGVFVQNFAPDAAGRFGCGEGEILAVAEPWSGEPS